MKIKDNFKMSFSGLTTHKSRSALTILGIVIGIMAIIVVMALGQSAQDLIIGEIQGLGPNNVYVHPGKQPKGITSAGASISNDSLKIRDYEDVKKKENIPDALTVVPIAYTSTDINYGSESYSGSMIFGSTPEIAKLYKLQVSNGYFFTEEDADNRSAVIILGKKIVDKLFGAASPVGQNVKIKNRNYRVIGVLEQKGQSSMINFDEIGLMPFSTVQQDVMGIKYIQEFLVEARSTETIPNVVKDLTTLLRNNHKIDNPDNDDFYIQTQADLVSTIGTITSVLTMFLGAVAAISLIVGGIGIMNIMFVSVTERTREIGLRKALGATNKNILVQFLTEAVLLTSTGGIIGIIFGATFTYLTVVALNTFAGMSFTFSFPVFGAFLGIAVSSSVGFFFGIFPARQASRKSPIEALRYE